MTDPSITVSGLRKLAEHAKTIGATRYAEAYLLVAERLEGMAEECSCDECVVGEVERG